MSESKAIDPMLDSLRTVTSNWDSKTPLEHKKRIALQKLTIDLKQYLIHRDPLRKFTPEMLDDRLTKNRTDTAKKVPPFVVFVLSSLAVGGIVLAIPFSLSITNRIYFAVVALLLTLIVITVQLYFSSLHNFNPALRTVFIYFCTGAGLLGIACLHYTIIGLLQLTNHPLFRYGGATEFGMLSVIALYLGLSKYAKILKISTKSISIRFSISIIAAIMIAIAIAYLRQIPDKLFFNFSLIATLIIVFCAFFGSRISLLLIKNVNASYAKSIRLVYIFQLAAIACAACFIVALAWYGSIPVDALSVIIAGAGTPTIALFMYSGYSFKKERVSKSIVCLLSRSADRYDFKNVVFL